MTQEEQLLLKDLCARLPYGVKVHTEPYGVVTLEPYHLDQFEGLHPIPYLRPMLSMTEEERRTYDNLACDFDGISMANSVDWLNENKFDYRGLIPMGLAIEAPKNMY